MLFWLFEALLITWSVATIAKKSSCSQPLGLTSGRVEDWQLAASSALSPAVDPDCAVKFARLHQEGSRAWCAGDPESSSSRKRKQRKRKKKRRKYDWLLVDLGVASTISGIVTQGRGEIDEWVTNFMISYSSDAFEWEYARDIYGNKKIFKGNSDAFQLRHSYLEHPIRARFVRVHVVGWIGHPSMRLEIVGCQECNEVISGLPFTELSASSYKRWSRKKNYKSCLPDMGDIASTKGWCPRRQNKRQWLQFDLGPPTAITGLVTRGQGDKKRYVTSYTMSYSNDSTAWTFYSEANDVEARVFGGNMDTFTERRHYLNEPVIARFVRIHPTTWHKRIGLRAAVLGCPHTGECGPGFMRVNEGAPCVANKAYKGLTWINDGSKSDSEEFRYGHSSFAVNGEPNADLSDCAIMDNFYADEPVWAVDLGAEQSVNGAVVVTWQGAGQDKITAYTDYVHSLDKLTVYVTTKRTKSADLNGESKCAAVSRMNNALFNPRVHFECPVVKRGRFVYVKASGVSDRWRKSFTVVLCQVQVY